ncbi:probable mitochondrial adenine nucleotide transporter BTL3 isoform X2 [Carya illinoinensis]|uniref:probable mitochondrial adenine nucleotide transporter BTL3 isoform X2 n=1 Tax=Carya illinoinensis TaxID=32201 RepID=UPI001C71E6E5|nr:probable mitochondrial adenine nucleotide transporter BTL3 isoform X2 [Carya illinoinensis]
MLLGLDLRFSNSYSQEQSNSNDTNLICEINSNLSLFGLFLEHTIPSSFINSISSRSSLVGLPGSVSSCIRGRKPVVFGAFRPENNVGFLTVSLKSDGFVRESKVYMVQNGHEGSEKSSTLEGADAVVEKGKKPKLKLRGGYAMNTTKHLWAGAVAAMVSRTFVAPLERLKLEYMVRGEQKDLFELIKTIAASQGLRGFWKGNLVNILRTAPFKAVNFYANDTYRKQLLKLSANKETTNFERFFAGAAAGITATILCLPLDTIRTKMVAPGGEALGGVIGAFHHMIRTEGFFSLYKGLVPSIISMAPSGAVFYGVYDILKSAYLHSPEGGKRIQNMSQQGQELSALDQLELGPMRTLLYGAIAGACAEAATYPFEVVRRRLQLQVRATKLGALATCVKIVEQGGIPALYAGLIPSLLQACTSFSFNKLLRL